MTAPLPPLDPHRARADKDLDSLVLGPEQAERRLVLLHGWGADADDLLDLGAALVADDPAVQLVALRAPGLHPAGQGRQWYDLQQPGWPELPAARQALRQRLLTLAGTVPLERTALLGFSQGAAMALDVAAGALPLAALIACSGYPHPDWQPGAAATGPGRVLLSHGREDPVVPFAACAEIERLLAASGLGTSSGRLECHGFSGGHGIDPSLFPRMAAVLASAWAASD